MATLNLGRLKPVFRGSWNNATAYSVDDIVVRNNQSYISIQAGTNQDPATATAYWTLMAAKGTDGTDVGATLTTQGDVLYRDGSGLQRLAAGTAGQVLQTGGAGANPSWTALSSDFVRVITAAGDGTAVLDVDNCFTADYENYLILGNVYVSTTTACYIRLQDASNSEINSNYFYVGYQAYKGSSNQGNDIKTGWNQSEWAPQENIAQENEGYGQFAINVSKPYINNHYTGMQIQYNAYDSSNFRYVWSNCFLRDDNTHKGFRFYVTSGNITSSSSISVYGMKTS